MFISSLARSLPAILGVHMVTVAVPELYSKVYGETEAQLRAKFDEARAKAPAVIFIDELDSVAPRREAGASDQERRVSAAFLNLLDRLVGQLTNPLFTFQGWEEKSVRL